MYVINAKTGKPEVGHVRDVRFVEGARKNWNPYTVCGLNTYFSTNAVLLAKPVDQYDQLCASWTACDEFSGQKERTLASFDEWTALYRSVAQTPGEKGNAIMELNTALRQILKTVNLNQRFIMRNLERLLPMLTFLLGFGSTMGDCEKVIANVEVADENPVNGPCALVGIFKAMGIQLNGLDVTLPAAATRQSTHYLCRLLKIPYAEHRDNAWRTDTEGLPKIGYIRNHVVLLQKVKPLLAYNASDILWTMRDITWSRYWGKDRDACGAAVPMAPAVKRVKDLIEVGSDVASLLMSVGDTRAAKTYANAFSKKSDTLVYRNVVPNFGKIRLSATGILNGCRLKPAALGKLMRTEALRNLAEDDYSTSTDPSGHPYCCALSQIYLAKSVYAVEEQDAVVSIGPKIDFEYRVLRQRQPLTPYIAVVPANDEFDHSEDVANYIRESNGDMNTYLVRADFNTTTAPEIMAGAAAFANTLGKTVLRIWMHDSAYYPGVVKDSGYAYDTFANRRILGDLRCIFHISEMRVTDYFNSGEYTLFCGEGTVSVDAHENVLLATLTGNDKAYKTTWERQSTNVKRVGTDAWVPLANADMLA